MSAFPTEDDPQGEGRDETGLASFSVGPDDVGSRLDAFLAAHTGEELSRSRLKALIEAGEVLLNGEICIEPSRKLKAGDVIVLALPEPGVAEPQPQDIPLTVAYEDDALIVVDKPAGMVVHPAPGNSDGTLVNALLFHCGDSLKGIGGVRRPGIVHRLDKETSGLIVAAKTQAAHLALAAQFADHGRTGPLQRAYLAFVWGVPNQLAGTIDASLGRSTANRLKRAVVAPDASDARHAVTRYKVLERFGDGDGKTVASLVECRLETGRTHQIRVHMSHIGHPLIGDREYGAHFASRANRLMEPARTLASDLKRQALHAALLGFRHPVTGETMAFSSNLPDDLQALLTALRGNSATIAKV